MTATAVPRVGITMPIEDGLSAPQMVALARTAEANGYHTVLCGEAAGPEVMALLGSIAASTSQIRLGSGIVATFTRTPTLTAMGFATLSSLAPGRVVAGLGASSPIIVGEWHGLAFEAPYERTKEFIEAMRACLAGGKVDYRGTHIAVRNFRLGIDPEQPIPLWVAAINPRMLRLAGAVADGVFLTWCPPEEVGEKLAEVRTGAHAVGRDPAEIEVICSFWGYAGPQTEKVTQRLRRVVLSYATVPTHSAAFSKVFPSLGPATDAWRAGERRQALDMVDDDVVRALCGVSDDGSATATLTKAYHDVGVDLPVILTIGAGGGDHEGPFTTVRLTADALGLRSEQVASSGTIGVLGDQPGS